MQTIHPRPRTVNDRRSHQTARPGWRPPKRSPRQRALYIADSIQARIAERRPWSFADYGIEGHPEMVNLVTQHLP